MRILVTGADGFIGGHLVRGLSADGHRVARSVYARAAQEGEVRVDLSRAEELEALPRDVDAIVHAAGSVDAHAPVAAMTRANVHTTGELLRWAKRTRVKHFVHLSSVAVYGPLVLGEDRDEHAPRLGLTMGLPYMRTKARAERLIEGSGVPYTLLRPPAVLGAGDSVVTRGFVDALARGGLPMMPGASPDRRVSLVSAEGVVDIVRRVLDYGPRGLAFHAVDAQLTFGELMAAYEHALGQSFQLTTVPWSTAFQSRNEVGIAWLLASSRFGQHYRSEKLTRVLGYHPKARLHSAIESGISGLQDFGRGLF